MKRSIAGSPLSQPIYPGERRRDLASRAGDDEGIAHRIKAV